ncbi:MAG: hypothetical protein IPN76_03840 [Saprospiraceae bacterium]|nr:hypothetical protein [Saprospiraceae bacterium]
MLKVYFSKLIESKKETIFHPYFFKILEAVFYKSPLNYAQILEAFQSEVSAAFKKGYTYENRFELYKQVKRTFVWLQFFSKLQLFENQNSAIMEPNTKVARNREDFEAQHPDFFNDPARQAAFNLGCLTEKLLEKQRKRLKSEPFKKYLKGLNLDLPLL